MLGRVKSWIKYWIVPPGLKDFFITIKHKLQNYRSMRLINNNCIGIKNSKSNQVCYILGGGSSVGNYNLMQLKGKDVISVSNTYVHGDYEYLRPKFHILPPLVTSHACYTEDQFCTWLRDMDSKLGDAEIVLDILDKNLIEKYNLFAGRKIVWVGYTYWNGIQDFDINLAKIPYIWSVSEVALTVAIYLGYKEIYLLGFDHDWFNGVMNYFYDYKSEHKLGIDLSKVSFADSEFQMRRHADIFKKYKYLKKHNSKIYIVNDGNTYVDVFPTVTFSQATHV